MKEPKPKKVTKRSIQEQEEEASRARATAAFAEHRIVRQDADRILIQRPHRVPATGGEPERFSGWESAYAVEMVRLSNGLLVYGDIAHVVFSYNSSRDVVDLLAWLSERLGSSYVEEKATIGMRLHPRQPISLVRVTYAHAAILRAFELTKVKVVTPALPAGDVDVQAPASSSGVLPG